MRINKQIKKEYLGRIENAVDKYVPLIEKRTGVNLGNVFVKDIDKGFIEDAYEIILNEQDYKTDLEKKIFKFSFLLAKPGVKSFIKKRYKKKSCLVYLDSTIYVPFGKAFKKNFKEVSSNDFNQVIEEWTVHELTHHLWDKISNERFDAPSSENYKIWSEGYATYGEVRWFSDFYPFGEALPWVKRMRNAEDVIGRIFIETLVDRMGQEVLLEIPIKWKEWDQIIAPKMEEIKKGFDLLKNT